MNCLPYNVKTFVNFFLALVTFANIWFGQMVFSLASKTFLTISWTVSGSFYMASLTINAIILFFFLPVALISFSYVSSSTFNFSYFSIFCDWILLCSAALHRSIHCVRVKSGSLRRISRVFYRVFLLLFVILSYRSQWRYSIHNL